MKPMYIIIAALWCVLGIMQIQDPTPVDILLDIIMIICSIVMIGLQDSLLAKSHAGWDKTLDLLKRVTEGWGKTTDTLKDAIKEVRNMKEGRTDE